MRPCQTRTGCIFCLHIKEGLVVGEVGADPTTLFRGTVLQTAEFADSLYSPLFVSLLYHILSHLSRGFFYFFWCDGLESNQHSTTTQAMCPATLKDHHIMSGFCSRHIPNIVSACGVWFTFVSRYTYTPCGRVIGRGLTDSRGHPHFVVASPSPVVLLL